LFAFSSSLQAHTRRATMHDDCCHLPPTFYGLLSRFGSRGHVEDAPQHQMLDAAYSYTCSVVCLRVGRSVCLSVCLLDTDEPCKMAETIEMPFRVRTRGGQGILYWTGCTVPTWMGTWGTYASYTDMPGGWYPNVTHKRAERSDTACTLLLPRQLVSYCFSSLWFLMECFQPSSMNSSPFQLCYCHIFVNFAVFAITSIAKRHNYIL